MATSSGIEAQLGLAPEVTYGTYVAPTKWYELVSDSLKFNIARVESKGLRAGRRAKHRWRVGTKSVSGDITMELAPQNLATILKQVLGDPVTTGAGPTYTHTFAGLKNIDDRSMSIQIGRPDEAGTVQPFSYLGMKPTKLSLSADVDAFVQMVLSVYGREETTAQSLATASYPTTVAPFVFTEANLTIAGSEVCVKSFNLDIDLKLATDRHRICATSAGRPKMAKINDIATINGTITADFESLTAYNRYVNGTEAALVLTFSNGTHSLTITMNTRFDGDTPNVSGPEMLEQSLKFEATSSTSDAAAFTAVLVSGDATA